MEYTKVKELGFSLQDIIIERILPRLILTDAGCFQWPGSSTVFGYGTIGIRGNCLMIHRLMMCSIIGGDIPQEKFVLHSCDNPGCCNPNHLRLGSPQDNMTDRSRRGNQGWKLNAEQVREIFRQVQAGKRKTDIAREYGIHRATVRMIAERKCWKHQTAGL